MPFASQCAPWASVRPLAPGQTKQKKQAKITSLLSAFASRIKWKTTIHRQVHFYWKKSKKMQNHSQLRMDRISTIMQKHNNVRCAYCNTIGSDTRSLPLATN